MYVLKYIVVAVLVVGLSSCQKATDLYLGVPLQPKLEDDNFEPGLNILGVLRPDFNDSISNSFVHVQEVAPAINNYPEFTVDSLIIRKANVTVSDENGERFLFAYTDYDSLFRDAQYRPASNFSVSAGEAYAIVCNYDDLPELTAETVVPNPPNVPLESIVLNGNNLSFEITFDSSSFMYEIYVFSAEENIGYHRVIPGTGNAEKNFVEMELTATGAALLVVYAYDYNLATYYATSNVSFNFNKYRKPFGDIDGGYGVFGSLNFGIYALN